MGSQTTGFNNTGIGKGALSNCSTGDNNTAIGEVAGADAVHNVTTGDNAIIVGNNSSANAYIKIDWTVTSDQRDKTQITDCPHGLSFLMDLQPRSFYYRKQRDSDVTSGPKRYGFLAQEVIALEGSDPVIIDNEDTENLKYKGESLVPILVNAVQELKTQLDAATARITALEG